jgi:uncharacterized protein YggE
MRALCAVALAIAATSLPAQTPATPADQRAPLIAASGEGKRVVPPDMVTIFVAVTTRSKSALNAGAQNAEQMAAVMRALRGVGIEERELSTAVYSLHPETWRSPSDTVYVASNGVRVESKKLHLVSRILDTAMTAGANNIGSLQFGLANPDSAERDALADAVRNARSRAEAMARAAGGHLGALEDLTSEPEAYRPLMEGVAMRAMGAAADVPTPVTPREITVTARVVARWRFVPAR